MYMQLYMILLSFYCCIVCIYIERERLKYIIGSVINNHTFIFITATNDGNDGIGSPAICSTWYKFRLQQGGLLWNRQNDRTNGVGPTLPEELHSNAIAMPLLLTSRYDLRNTTQGILKGRWLKVQFQESITMFTVWKHWTWKFMA